MNSQKTLAYICISSLYCFAALASKGDPGNGKGDFSPRPCRIEIDTVCINTNQNAVQANNSKISDISQRLMLLGIQVGLLEQEQLQAELEHNAALDSLRSYQLELDFLEHANFVEDPYLDLAPPNEDRTLFAWSLDPTQTTDLVLAWLQQPRNTAAWPLHEHNSYKLQTQKLSLQLAENEISAAERLGRVKDLINRVKEQQVALTKLSAKYGEENIQFNQSIQNNCRTQVCS